MPIIQLSFDNPLNTSVQVGDNAYFSNPVPVSTPGNPFGGQWTSTTTPHVTNDIDGVVDLGEILTITPWDGTNSFITCDMDQVLFNKYFSSIIAGHCVTTISPTGATGECANYLPAYGSPNITIPQPWPTGAYNSALHGNNATTGYFQMDFFTNNPSLSVHDYMTHDTMSENAQMIATSISSDWCLIDGSSPMYEAGYINYWQRTSPFVWSSNGFMSGVLSPSFPTVNGLISYLAATYPNSGVIPGTPWGQIDVSNVPGSLVGIGGGPLTGTYTGATTTTCSPGSYIMFSKDNKANMSSILGYYASVEYRNSSQIKSELFNVGVDFFESSK
tara:strand:+ start:13275 stop:14267 length:993 start_codon:yes stop_codon:yes gene_type:complete